MAEAATGADGTIWLKLAAPSDRPAAWLVLDSAGDPIGRIELPAAQQVRAVSPDRIAALELDEFDVPRVVVYRLER